MPSATTLPATLPIPAAAVEAHATLCELAHGLTGRIPAELLARHVLQTHRSAGWAVQRAALEAILRRVAFAQRDGLRVARWPRSGAFGAYATRRARAGERAWRTRLDALEPGIRASCDCPDFLRGSLGVCKHVLCVLDHLARSKRRFAALRQAEPARTNPTRLAWDPVRPLVGAGDSLARLHVHLPAAPRGALKDLLAADARGDWRLAELHADAPEKRLQIVRTLRAWAARSAPDAEPAAARLLADEEARLARVVEARMGSARALQALRKLRHPLHPYQRAGIERFLATGRLLLADDMGLGKTVQAIAACHALWTSGAVRRGLIVVPASLKPQWLREWRGWTNTPVTLLEGEPEARAATWKRTREGFLLVNYEQVLRDHDLAVAWSCDLAVLDEAQRIKNWQTKSAACVKALRPAWRLVLTGTPMENRLDELASILDWVDDHALEPKWRLAPQHAVVADGERRAAGARDLDVLRERLAPCFLRRVRQEVLSQLPSRTDTCVPIELTLEQGEEHDALNQPIASLTRITERRPLSREEFQRLMSLLNRQRMIANALAQAHFEEVWPTLAEAGTPRPELLGALGSPKLLHLRELLQALCVDQGRKVVVFSQWRRMLILAEWAVRDVLGAAGLRGVFFTGREGQAWRTQNLVEFHDDPAAAVLFATDAGGVGLNLQRAASACVNLELPWNPAVLEQRVGRIHRMGQTLPIDAYSLVAQGCIEERIAGLVGGKRALFRALFDEGADEVRFEGAGSFVQRLRAVVPAGGEGSGAAEDEEAADDEGDLRVEVVADSEERAEVGAEADGAGEDGGEAEAVRSPEVSGAAAAQGPAEVEPVLVSAPPDAVAQRVTAAGEAPAWLGSLRVERGTDGSLTIHAPPETAGELARVFSGLAAILAEAARR